MIELEHPLHEVLTSFDVYRRYLWIKEKLPDGVHPSTTRRIVRYTPNSSQQYLYNLLPKAQTPIGLWALILKSRQIGISTAIINWFFYLTATRPNVFTQLASHRIDSAENFNLAIKLLHTRLPPELQPQTLYSNRRELIFNNKNGDGLNSHLMVSCAESGDLGASFTINNLHITEIARWQKPKETLTTLFQAVPSHSSSCCIIESTAKGAGQYFQELWQASWEALQKGEKSQFYPIFIPWFVHDEYQLGFSSPHERDDFEQNMTEEERKYMAVYALSLEQMNWRALTMRHKCHNSPLYFGQEYPATPEEAFIYGQESIFDLASLHEQAQKCRPPTYGKIGIEDKPELARLNIIGPSMDVMAVPRSLITFEPHHGDAGLALFHLPNPARSYVVGVDAASGKVDIKASNLSAIFLEQFYESPNFTRVVCDFTCQMPIEEFAYHLVLLCRFYNDAFMCVEDNNHGAALIQAIFKIFHYSNLYRRYTFNKLIEGFSDAIGWHTSASTRPILLDSFEKAVRCGDTELSSQALVSEGRTFVFNEITNRPEPAAGCKGDRVFGGALALQAHVAHPPRPPAKGYDLFPIPPPSRVLSAKTRNPKKTPEGWYIYPE